MEGKSSSKKIQNKISRRESILNLHPLPKVIAFKKKKDCQLIIWKYISKTNVTMGKEAFSTNGVGTTDYPLQKNEVGHLLHIIYKKPPRLKMDWRPKYNR